MLHYPDIDSVVPLCTEGRPGMTKTLFRAAGFGRANTVCTQLDFFSRFAVTTPPPPAPTLHQNLILMLGVRPHSVF